MTPRRVSEVMSRAPVIAGLHTTVAEAERLCRATEVHHLLVREGGDLRGIVCSCDLMDAPRNAHLESCMRSPVTTIAATATLADAAHTMRDHAITCLPVIARDDIVGVITLTDLERVGLVEADPDAPRCASCGSRRHLRPDEGSIVCFCADCLARARPTAVQDELGTVD